LADYADEIIEADYYDEDTPGYDDGGDRLRAHVINAYVDAYLINAPARNGTPRGYEGRGDTSVPEYIITTRMNQQTAGGMWGGTDYQGSGQNGQKSFMAGIFNLAILRYYYWVNARADIPTAVKDNNDWTWANAWDASPEGMMYVAPRPAPAENDNPEPCLNMLSAYSYAWSWAYDSDTTDRDRFDAIINGLVTSSEDDCMALYDDSPLYGAKQFDQTFLRFWRSCRWRNGEIESTP
jgi:hypothetical protein